MMHHVDDLLSVLVGQGSLFSEQALAMHTHGDALSNQLIEQLPTRDRLLCGGAALPASSTVTARAETLRDGARSAHQHKRVTAHIAWNEHRLPHSTILFRQRQMICRES